MTIHIEEKLGECYSAVFDNFEQCVQFLTSTYSKDGYERLNSIVICDDCFEYEIW